MSENGQKQGLSLAQQAHNDVMREQDEKAFAEIRRLVNDSLKIEVYQQDWIPGFAAFCDDGSVKKGTAHVCLNVGSLMASVADKDFTAQELPYIIAESIMHEVIHVLEAWAGVAFDEEKVEALLMKYREKYGNMEPEDEDEEVLTEENLWDCPCGGGKPKLTETVEVDRIIPHNVTECIVYMLRCDACHVSMGDKDKQKAFHMWNDFVGDTTFRLRWGYEAYLNQLPDCKCGGRPRYSHVDFPVNGEAPYVLQCDKCLHKIGNIDSYRAVEMWIESSSDPQATFVLYDDTADHLEGQS